MIRHCSMRQLGDFDYEDEFFRVERVENDIYDDWDNRFCLRYIGQDSDCSSLKLPDGLKNAGYMFENSFITDPPVIPRGVENCEGMFRGSSIRYAPFIPFGVKNCSYMFEFTPIEVPPLLPGSISQGTRMFADCQNLLRKAPRRGTFAFREFEEMYAGCPELQGNRRKTAETEKEDFSR